MARGGRKVEEGREKLEKTTKFRRELLEEKEDVGNMRQRMLTWLMNADDEAGGEMLMMMCVVWIRAAKSVRTIVAHFWLLTWLRTWGSPRKSLHHRSA